MMSDVCLFSRVPGFSNQYSTVFVTARPLNVAPSPESYSPQIKEPSGVKDQGPHIHYKPNSVRVFPLP